MTRLRATTSSSTLRLVASRGIQGESGLADLGIFSLADYGGVGDGTTNETVAWKAWVAAISANGGGTAYIPKGTYLLDPFDITDTTTRDLMTIPANTTVIGDGPTASIIKCNAAVHNANQTSTYTSWRLVRIGADCIVGGIGVDGDKASHTARTQSDLTTPISTRSIPFAVAGADCHVERVHAYNTYSTQAHASLSDAEGWGIGIAQVSRCTLRDCQTYNNYGSGLSINGEHSANAADIINVSGLISFGNSWSGCTVFGSQRVNLDNILSYRNGYVSTTTNLITRGNGLNLEYASNVRGNNIELRQNARANLNISGYSRNITLTNMETYYASDTSYWVTSGSAMSTTSGEIRMVMTTFDATADVGAPANVTLSGVFTPYSDGAHVQYSSPTAGTTEGVSLPQLTLIGCRDQNGLLPSRWVYETAGTARRHGASLRIGDLRCVDETPIGDMETVPTLTNMTITDGHTVTGAYNGTADTYLCTATGADASWVFDVPSQVSLQYIRFRMMPVSNDGFIRSGFRDSASITQYRQEMRWQFQSSDTATWFDVFVFSEFTKGTTTYQAIQFADTSGTSWYLDGAPVIGRIDGLGVV